MIRTTQDSKRIAELEAMKEKQGQKFPQERQWELDGLLEREVPKKVVKKAKGKKK